MTDHTDLIAAARRAEGSELLPSVQLGRYRADDLLLRMADALEAQAERIAEMEAAQAEAERRGAEQMRECAVQAVAAWVREFLGGSARNAIFDGVADAIRATPAPQTQEGE